MILYTYRKSDLCYTGQSIVVESEDELHDFLHFYTPIAPPAQEGHHAVWENGGWVLVPGNPPVDVEADLDIKAWRSNVELKAWRNSASCTPFQGRMALSKAGYFSAVESIINNPATSPETKIAWNHAVIWNRSSPMIDYLASALGLNDSQVDDLFVEAQKIIV